MNCPYCAFEDSKVTDSRPASGGGIRRRRECLSCGRRFTTVERVELGGLLVAKKDGRREEFSRDKLLAGVRKACEKRPIPLGAIEALVDDVENMVHAQGKAEVPTRLVGELVMARLRDLDDVAYIRFASVYRAFRDVSDLKEELATLERGRAQPAASTTQLPLLPAEALEGAPQRPRLRAVPARRAATEHRPLARKERARQAR
ncbi:MAG: transcriptional regulator NrdR [Longimicrobiales bacterium]|nr:transcriptional regulator NrdR [Longimicrobiales bacterium]